MGQVSHKSGVRRQIGAGVAILGAIYGIVFFLTPAIEANDSTARLALAAKLLGFVSLPLIAGVGATVLARYGDSSLIHGYKAPINDRLAMLLAFNLNTLEQTVLHALSIAAFCVTVPGALLSFAVAQVGAFIIGRALFFVGYRRNPLHRFVGFVVSYYPALAAIVAACTFTIINA